MAYLLLRQEGMLLTTLLTLLVVGVSSVVLWLAIGAE
jgi:hypothetical protein